MLSRDWLLVNGNSAEEVASLIKPAVQFFAEIHQLRLSDTQAGSHTFLATFADRDDQTNSIVRTQLPEKWACASGTFMSADAQGSSLLEKLVRGDSKLESVEGCFGIAICDVTAQSAQVITDRLGTLHVYEAQFGSSLIVCTSSMVIAAMLNPEWDLESCREFLAMGTVFEQRTLFKGIEKLRPASIYQYREGKRISIERHWNLPSVLFDQAPFRGTPEVLADALKSALHTINRHYPRAVLDLTGGFDSRALLAAMLAVGARFDTVVNGAADHEDVLLSRPVAEKAGVHHHHRVPSSKSPAELWASAQKALALCDGEYDILEYAQIFDVHSELSTRFGATINGSNGEICKGYWWELLAPFTGRKGHFDSRRVAAGRFAFAGERRLLANDFTVTIEDHMAEVIQRANRGLEIYPNTAKMDNVYLTLRMQRWQGRLASATNRIWPCISPFMFGDVMNQALAAPPATRVRNRMSRRLIELLSPSLAELPVTGGGPALPLRLSTVHRFGPLVTEEGRRLSQRVFAKKNQSSLSPVRDFWSLEQIRETLTVAGMRSVELYDRDRLSTLLTESQSDACSNRRLFGRVLTLECVAREIYRVRASKN